MSYSDCCLNTFKWEGTPTGSETKLGNNDTYVATPASGSDTKRAILLVHDALGWTFPNLRLLADHYASESNSDVFMPDFFAGEVLPPEPICKGRWHEVDMKGFTTRNSRDIREPEIFACAKLLKEKYSHVAAVGFCFGGWAVFRLGAKEHSPPLVDCIIAGHPTWLTKKDIDEVAVPTQVLAPEIDPVYTPELKLHTFQTLQKNGVVLDYQHYPGVSHACFTRGDDEVKGEREAMTRGKDAVVAWVRQWC